MWQVPYVKEKLRACKLFTWFEHVHCRPENASDYSPFWKYNSKLNNSHMKDPHVGPKCVIFTTQIANK